MKLMKKLFGMLLVIVLATGTIAVQAQGTEDATEETRFSDVDESDWEYEYIELMADYGIITGYPDGTFRPDNPVTRGEFAKMMVLTLGLDLISPSTPTFEDVASADWEYAYVETAKWYLTGWSTPQGYYYKPDTDAVREDMAVGIAKGLSLDTESVDLSVLNGFTDKDDISSNLVNYVAAVANEEIMIGNDESQFLPQNSITRAETATLLARLIMEEKVTFDEEKITFDEPVTEETSQTPYLQYEIVDGKVVFNWTEVDSENFNYYKVVLSKGDSTPKYSENGYAKAISNTSTVSYKVYDGHGYNGGDLGGEIEGGETYYASITAVYGGDKYTSNVVVVTVPDLDNDSCGDDDCEEDDSNSCNNDCDDDHYTREDMTPELLSASVQNGGIQLTWSKTEGSGFHYYKVVFSATNSEPSYPDDGYLTYISNDETVTYFAEAGDTYYSESTLPSLESGQSYYIAITAVYDSGKYTSNVITKTLP